MIIADTGFWLALANRGDQHHERAVRALDRHGDTGFICTWPVVAETCRLLLHRLGGNWQSDQTGKSTRQSNGD